MIFSKPATRTISQWRPNCIRLATWDLRLAQPFCKVIRGKMPSRNVGGPLSVAQLFCMDYGVSVLEGPLMVMKVPPAASKFKATSYYSVHPLVLSATDIAC